MTNDVWLDNNSMRPFSVRGRRFNSGRSASVIFFLCTVFSISFCYVGTVCGSQQGT